MSEHTNPAQRVLVILRKAQKHSEKASSRQAWGAILGVDPADTRELLRALADFINLVDEARGELQRLSNVNADLYLEPLDQIQKACSEINLQGNWLTFRRYLDQSTMTALTFCADTLGQSWQEKVIDPKSLSSLLEDIQSLITEVAESDVDEELKKAILDNLLRIQHAILAYELLGVRGLRLAMESALGSLLVLSDRIREMPEDESKGRSTVAKFFQQIERLNKLISAARGVQAVVWPIIKLIGGPGAD